MEKPLILRMIRKNMGLTQESFARKLDIATRTVSRWETGKSQPSPIVLTQLASMLCLLVGRVLGAPSQAYSNYVTLRNWANQIVGIAINKSRIPKPTTLPCSDCGCRASYYDHRDYYRPLQLSAVCASCNRKRGMALATLFHPHFWTGRMKPSRPKNWESNDL